MKQGDPLTNGLGVFRCQRFAPEYPGLAGRDLTPRSPIELYDVTISGTFGTLLKMIDGQIDSDALFFNRELTITGDADMNEAAEMFFNEILKPIADGYIAERIDNGQSKENTQE